MPRHRARRRTAPSAARLGRTAPGTRPYTDHPLLGLYAFEESYVLAYGPVVDGFEFELDLAPTRSHPAWHPPPATDWITWWRGRLVFRRCRDLLFVPTGIKPSIDANNEADFGNIDSFMLEDEGYRLEGEWGTLSMTNGTVTVEVDTTSSTRIGTA